MEQDQQLLETQLEPILKYFDDESVIEIMLKGGGSVIVESFRTRILAHQEEKKILFQNYSMGAKFRGCRVHVITPPVSTDGIVINFRIPPRLNPTLEDYVEGGLLAGEQADYLREIVAAKKNIVICGGTGSGKTTLLRALLLLSKKKERFLNLSFFTNSTQVYFSNAASTVDL